MCSEARRVLLLYQLYSRANIDIRIRRRVIQVQVTAAFRAIIPVPTDDGGAQGAHPLQILERSTIVGPNLVVQTLFLLLISRSSISWPRNVLRNFILGLVHSQLLRCTHFQHYRRLVRYLLSTRYNYQMFYLRLAFPQIPTIYYTLNFCIVRKL